MKKIIIDNRIQRAVQDGEIVNHLTLGGGVTRHGIKFRLRRGWNEIDGTYDFDEIESMTYCYNAVITISRGFTEEQWDILVSCFKGNKNVTILDRKES